MKRRTLIMFSIFSFGGISYSNNANAAIPFFLSWLARFATYLLRRQALSTTARGALGRAAVKHTVSAKVIAYRALSTARVLKKISAFTLSTIALDEVYNHVMGTPEDSILRWTLAYYAVLTQSNVDAAMGMWVDPPDANNFNHLKYGNSNFKITELIAQTRSKVRATVIAQNVGEVQKEYNVEIEWAETDHGHRINSFKTVV